MKLGICFLWIFLVQLQASLAVTIIDSQLASACTYYFNKFDWGCDNTGTGHMAGWPCRCASDYYLASVANCVEDVPGFSNHQRKHALKHVKSRCLLKGERNFPVSLLKELYDETKDNLVDPHEFLNMTDPTELNVPVNQTLYYNDADFAIYLRTFVQFTDHVLLTQWLSWGLNYYWCFIIFLGLLNQINRHFIGLSLPMGTFFQKYVQLPGLFSNKFREPVRFWKYLSVHLPTRLQLLILIPFIIYTVLATALHYEVELPNVYINESYFLTLDLIGYRSGIMSFALLPTVYFFGIRNNPFALISGFSFADFNFFHKTTAIVMTIEALIHSAVWTAYAINSDGGYMSLAYQLYWKVGILGTVVIFIILFQSSSVFRERAYETFLFIHKALNMVFIASMWHHCIDFGWMGWIYSMIAIWGFDRVMRLVRIIFAGGYRKATLRLYRGDILRLTIQRPRFFPFFPGAYGFLYFYHEDLPSYCLWQSHPFTVVPSKDKKQITFYFRARDGITSDLKQLVLKSAQVEIPIRVALEGPYGNILGLKKQLKDEKTTQFVALAGGMGICSVFPHLNHLISIYKQKGLVQVSTEDSSDSQASNDDKNSEKPKKEEYYMPLKLYWTVDDLAKVYWFADQLEWLAAHGVEVKVWHTGSKSMDDYENAEFDSLMESLKNVDFVQATSRLCLKSTLDEEIKQAKELDMRNLSLFVCGPPSFNDDARAALCNSIDLKSSLNISLEEEFFGW
ncbi:Ferric reductase and cupric reductase [Komagataella phaffii CBS 7435]|uniref:ferric-chelate reductase (NADPH) n=1 Tax=Komagataella phaffii (strain ATCC 76273 / CBS 7435 / CECT 11047 / NRRL Y-11430 / Wegner 21-1) TaxID=981350 RepID=F2QUT2_KOMPC|nr:GQ67_04112T0 [Komagataella phaffii]AOA69120.1 GQ68_04085T0 [Komagataella phaffii GS115]CAH2449126.1 Ferric reductase and cupric reductase [Komagataella phaffii CBS 7435]CCA39160.1 Ferric reductase and cupric reductase [Komagataella phaffii CBS 7435]